MRIRRRQKLAFESLESRQLLHAGVAHDFDRNYGDFHTAHDDAGQLYLVLPDEHYQLDLEHATTYGVRDIQAIQLSYLARNEIQLNSSTAARLATTSNQLSVLYDFDDVVQLDGDWRLQDSEYVPFEFSFLVSDGTTELKLTGGTPYRNPISPVDVNGDSSVFPIDALMVINALRERGAGPLNAPTAAFKNWELIDSNGDNSLTAQDALLVVNSLLEHGSHEVFTPSHGHHNMDLDVGDEQNPPQVSLNISADDFGGWNARVELSNFRLAPDNVSQDHVAGEGHMHLYIDGEKIGRLYNEAFHIPPLPDGDHEVMVELSANTHARYAIDGTPITDTVVVKAGGQNREEMEFTNRTAAPAGASVQLHSSADPHGGWNLRMHATEFTFADEVGADEGGFGLLYVNGVPVSRLYGPWYHLGKLPEGTHEIRVVLTNSELALLEDSQGELVHGTHFLHVTADGSHTHTMNHG